MAVGSEGTRPSKRWRFVPWLLMGLLVAGAGGCARRTPPPAKPAAPPAAATPPAPPTAAPLPREGMRIQEGVASWYGPGFHGNRTSSGETYDMFQMTAAHQTLPLGTRVLVTNLENHRTAEVLVNDRGPFLKDRVIDLSYAAAHVIGMVGPGTARVRVEILESPSGGPPADFSVKPLYVLQLGAFSEKANAQNLQGELERIMGGGSARVIPAKIGSQEVHRVRVGKYVQREEAAARAQDLAKRGYVVLVVTEYPE